MNLQALFNGVKAAVKGAAGSGVYLAKKHAPALCTTAGILGFGITIYETTKATNKSRDILEEKKRLMDFFEKRSQEGAPEEYNVIDIATLNKNTKWALVRTWAPVATTGMISAFFVLTGYKMVNGRFVATAAAYKGLEATFERYRGNVVQKFGKDVDWEMYTARQEEEIEKARMERERNREIDQDNKKRKILKKKKTAVYRDTYDNVFDDYSDRWQRYWTPEQVLHYLRRKEDEANDMLMIRGHVFVNEINDMLGFERTPAGAITGWVKHGNTGKDPHQKVISFGLDEMPEEELRAILGAHRNCDIRVKIRLNPMGIMYNMIDKKDYATED